MPSRTRARLAACIGAACAAAATAQTVTVTTTSDTVDAGNQIGNLPGPDGVVSLREAVAVVNSTPGPQTIEFAIPESDWWLHPLAATLRLTQGPFILTDDETTVDFASQTAFTGDTNASGSEVEIFGQEPNGWGTAAIYVNGDNCVIKGLGRVMWRGYAIQITGNNNRVIGCTISEPLHAAIRIDAGNEPDASGNVIGGTLPEERNVLSSGGAGVRLTGRCFNNVIIGNTIVGSRFAGVEVLGANWSDEYSPFDNRIGGPTPEEANWIADNGSFGEEGFPLGDNVDIEYAIGTIVEGNNIGTNMAGDGPFNSAAGTAGVLVRASVGTIVRNNVISGIRKEGRNHFEGEFFGIAVEVSAESVDTVIAGNRIGVAIDGATPIPNHSGISFFRFPGEGAPTDSLIGGEDPAAANIIAHGDLFGVATDFDTERTAILGNSIFNNGALGIDHYPDGVTSEGAPTLASAEGDGSSVTVAGTLAAEPNQTYRIEFFASDECDPSGFGEGQFFLGFTNVTTDAAGVASYEVALSAPVGDGASITATATNLATTQTSEFSACVPASIDGGLFGDIDGDGAVDFTDLNLLLSAYNDSGEEMPEDLDGDGLVNFADLNLLLGVYNAGA